MGWGAPQRGPAWSPDSVTRCPGLTWVVRAGHRPGGQEADVAPSAGAAGEQGLARHPELCFLLMRRQHPERPHAGGFQQPGEARVLLPTRRRGFCCLGLPPPQLLALGWPQPLPCRLQGDRGFGAPREGCAQGWQRPADPLLQFPGVPALGQGMRGSGVSWGISPHPPDTAAEPAAAGPGPQGFCLFVDTLLTQGSRHVP